MLIYTSISLNLPRNNCRLRLASAKSIFFIILSQLKLLTFDTIFASTIYNNTNFQGAALGAIRGVLLPKSSTSRYNPLVAVLLKH